ncbi:MULTISPECIES: hypothetical protein [Myxococcaceae]|uniref:hypothetical protein n=1 Tax=Myxococcaceae TaxID=31 RepID=UPI00129C8CEF|nr:MULTISPECIES: hypothetical protein [Myxococcaceae]MBF5046306.1 hypothetical protein [Simulacricoccus sp. 17bor-14]
MMDQGNDSGVRAQAFALTRDSWNFSALLDACMDAFRRDWLLLSVGALLTMLIPYGVSLVGMLAGAIAGQLSQALVLPITVVQALLQFAVQSALTLGLMAMALQALRGAPVELGQLFGQVRQAPRYLFLTIVAMLAMLVPLGALAGAGYFAYLQGLFAWNWGTLAFLGLLGLGLFVLFVYATLPLYFLVPETVLCAHPGMLQPLRNCYRVVDGQRLPTLAAMFISSGLMLAGVVACCVGVVPALAAMQLLMGGLYLALRHGADVERP